MQLRALLAVCSLAGALAFGGGWLLGWVLDPGVREHGCSGLLGCSSAAVAVAPIVTPTTRVAPAPVRTARPPSPRATRSIPTPAPTTSAPPTTTTAPPVTSSAAPTADPAPATSSPPTSAAETTEPLLLPILGR